MKIQLNAPMLGLDGKEPIIEEGKILTLKDICIASLVTPVQGDEEKTKLDKYDVYKKFRDCKGDNLTLTSDEVTLVKRAVGKIQPTLIVGQVFELIEKD